jgi:hypothetical protein
MATQVVHLLYQVLGFHSQLQEVAGVAVCQVGEVLGFFQVLAQTVLIMEVALVPVQLLMAEPMVGKVVLILEVEAESAFRGKMENYQLYSSGVEYQVIDNFLSEEDFKAIQDLMMGDFFAWHYHKAVTYTDEEKDDKAFYFTHLFYSNPKITSDHIQTLNPLLEKLDVKAFIRIKGNMYPNLNGYSPQEPHTDYPYSHKGAIFYINTNDGCTILEDGTRIASVANRILFFDPSKMHDSTYPSDQKVRVNININYF